MLALVSPAKKLDFESECTCDTHSQPDFLRQSQDLIDVANKLSRPEIQSLMKLSDKLADLNYQRYQNFTTPFNLTNAKQAVFAFRGDTYVGLDADTLSTDDLDYAQNHLRLLSGLYGMLRPLDLMQAYRLEMGTKLHNPKGEDLYDFWEDQLAKACNDIVADHKTAAIINLASNEYIKAVPKKSLNVPFITCHFKEIKEDGSIKVIGLFAKRARGMMARYMIQNRIDTIEGLKEFKDGGYKFDANLSDETNLTFTRPKP